MDQSSERVVNLRNDSEHEPFVMDTRVQKNTRSVKTDRQKFFQWESIKGPSLVQLY